MLAFKQKQHRLQTLNVILGEQASGQSYNEIYHNSTFYTYYISVDYFYY